MTFIRFPFVTARLSIRVGAQLYIVSKHFVHRASSVFTVFGSMGIMRSYHGRVPTAVLLLQIIDWFVLLIFDLHFGLGNYVQTLWYIKISVLTVYAITIADNMTLFVFIYLCVQL